MRNIIWLVGALLLASCATIENNDSLSLVDSAQATSQEKNPVTAISTEETTDTKRLDEGEILTEASKKRKSGKKVCKYDAKVTSRIRKKTCRTQAEWDYIEKETQKEIERLRRDNPNQGRGGATLPGGQ